MKHKLTQPRPDERPAGKTAGTIHWLWHSLFSSGFDEDPQSPFMRRVKFTNIFAITCTAALFVFVVVNYHEGNMLAAVVELAFAMFGVFILVYLRRTHDINRAQTMVMIDVMSVLSFLFFTGGIAKTGIFWLYTLPAGAFFLKGRKWGWVWLAIIGIEVIVMVVLNALHVISMPYAFITIRQFVACFVVVALIVSNYERIRDDYERVIAVKTQELVAEIEHRKQVETALRDSRQKFKTIFERASDGMFIIDLETRKFRIVNQASLNMLGYTQEEFLSRDIRDIHPPEELPVIFEQIAKFMNGQEGIRNDVKFLRKDGTVFIADLSPASVTLTGKKSILVVFKDITERKKAEDTLRESEKDFRAMFENSTDGMFIAELESKKFLSANSSCLKMLGLTQEEFLCRDLRDIHPPEELPRIFEKISKFISGGEDFRMDCSFKHKDGTIVTTDLSPTMINYHGKRAFLVSFKDITARKRLEKALLESEKKYRELFENAGDAIFITDTETEVILDVNRMAEDLLGMKKQEIIGLNRAMVHPRTEEYAGELNRHVRAEKVTDAESMVVNRDGRHIPVSISAATYDIGGRKVIQGIFRDVTERKKAEAEREAMINDLKEALANIKQLKGLIPICASCKKIRNDKGYWQQVEVYIKEHSEADFSHGMCEDCAQKLYPEYYPPTQKATGSASG